MTTHVYANGREIACQAADGIASPAFPDPCWTPPPPPAGPVVIPYANTARPKTLKKGSRKVFIGGKPVALGDKSYFSTSIGDELATHGLAKGVISGVIKGKAYFRSWSMNVIIEGHGVARHLDRMTHNHGSSPGNTPPFPYISRAWNDDDKCKEDRERAEEACKPTSKPEERKKKDGKKWHWTDDHCAGLDKKLDRKTHANSYISEQKEALKNKPKNLAELTKSDPELAKTMANMGEKTAAEYFNGLKGVAERFDNFDPNKAAERKGALKLATEGQGMLATLNPCMRALKCRLVPYKSSKANAETTLPSEEKNQTRGCCEGQTGHHLIYGAMAKKKQGGECSKYSHNKAPTVCVEGFSQNHGTHKLVHDKMDEIVGSMVTHGYRAPDGTHKRIGADGKMTLNEAITAASKSHTAAFPLSGCSEKCIEVQLRDFYEEACQNGKFATVNKNGKPHDELSSID